MKINTNAKNIEELVERGVEEVYPDKASLEKKLKSGKKIKLYCGFDPSTKSLHIGNAILINKLAQFQKLGHEVIFLIGDFTGMIGDPSDKSSARKKLSREEVLKNSKDYQKQASSFLNFDAKNPATVKYNSEWNDKLTFKDLIELSSNFTVQQMLQRDMFQKRQEQEKPIYLHEFLYPLTQAYDSVAMDVDLEIGGNDQMFNMMCGRDLLKSLKNKEKFVLTMKLLADENGKKMGKSEGNAVFLDEEASEIYGKVMSWSDKFMPIAFELCTQIEWQEVKEIQKKLKTKDVNFRDMKMKLAKEITASIKGDKEAQAAEEYFVKTIQKKEVPDSMEELALKKNSLNILELLVLTKLTASKGEARRLINQNGLKIDGVTISSVDLEVDLGKTRLIQKGKRHFLKVKK